MERNTLIILIVVILLLALLAWKVVFAMPMAMMGAGKVYIKGPHGETEYEMNMSTNFYKHMVINTPHGKVEMEIEKENNHPLIRMNKKIELLIKTGKVVIQQENGTIIIQTPHKNITITPEDLANKEARVRAALVYQLKLQMHTMNQTMKFEVEQENGKVVMVHRERVRAKILGILPVSTEVEVKVDPETGQIVVKRPWWYFLVTIAEPETTTVQTSANLSVTSAI